MPCKEEEDEVKRGKNQVVALSPETSSGQVGTGFVEGLLELCQVQPKLCNCNEYDARHKIF
jgi:hypothetical protein